jgi:Fungal specific transcription factor domain
LETRLHKVEEILQYLAPDLDLNDPHLLSTDTEQIVATLRRDGLRDGPASKLPVNNAPQQQDTCADAADGSFLETMMENSGSLDLDDQGHWDYHGHSSSIIFMQRLRKQIGNVFSVPLRPLNKPVPIMQMLDSPKSQSESPQDLNGHHLPPTHDLPARDVAMRLCQSAFGHACIVMRFIHEPTFWATFDRVYATSYDQFTNEEHTFLPLLYVAMAVGCLFSTSDAESTIDKAGYEGAIGQGYVTFLFAKISLLMLMSKSRFQYFRAGRHLLDITDCRDLITLQAICFMVLFLQSTAKLSTCYSYVGIALRAALRLGLHRNVAANFDPVESELRKRIFWTVRKMDIYVSSLLGLPQMVNKKDIDQEYPLDIDDEFITPTGILAMPSNRMSFMAGANAHSSLTDVIIKVVKYIYPVKLAKHQSKADHTYMISHAKIREIERDLQVWLENLPPTLRPGSEVSPEYER